MSKEAQKALLLNSETQKKFDECVAALTAMRFGPDGPPKDTTFAEIESFGHEVGRMLGRAVDEKLTRQHARQYQESAICPTCHTECPIEDLPSERQMQTCDGPIGLEEPKCHCSVCDRDFFPSASRTED